MRMPRKTKKAFRKFDRQLGARERQRVTRVSHWLTHHFDGTWSFWIPVKRRVGSRVRKTDVALFAFKVPVP